MSLVSHRYTWAHACLQQDVFTRHVILQNTFWLKQQRMSRAVSCTVVLVTNSCPSLTARVLHLKPGDFFFCCYTRLFMTWGLHEPLNYSTHLLHCTHAHTLAHTHTHILPRSKFTNTAPEPSLCSTASRGRRTSGLTCPHPLQCVCAFEIRGMRDEREKTRCRVRHPLMDMQANIHTKRCSQPMLHNTTRYESALCLAEAKHMHKI